MISPRLLTGALALLAASVVNAGKCHPSSIPTLPTTLSTTLAPVSTKAEFVSSKSRAAEQQTARPTWIFASCRAFAPALTAYATWEEDLLRLRGEGPFKCVKIGLIVRPNFDVLQASSGRPTQSGIATCTPQHGRLSRLE
ncbi:hypothetical protein ACJZ2D_006489 [Fusarium nematophilum]